MTLSRHDQDGVQVRGSLGGEQDSSGREVDGCFDTVFSSRILLKGKSVKISINRRVSGYIRVDIDIDILRKQGGQLTLK